MKCYFVVFPDFITFVLYRLNLFQTVAVVILHFILCFSCSIQFNAQTFNHLVLLRQLTLQFLTRSLLNPYHIGHSSATELNTWSIAFHVMWWLIMLAVRPSGNAIGLDQQSYSTPGPVSTAMVDRSRVPTEPTPGAGKSSSVYNQLLRLTQPGHPSVGKHLPSKVIISVGSASPSNTMWPRTRIIFK